MNDCNQQFNDKKLFLKARRLFHDSLGLTEIRSFVNDTCSLTSIELTVHRFKYHSKSSFFIAYNDCFYLNFLILTV